MPSYIIGRVYNAHGPSDWFYGNDDKWFASFTSGRKAAARFADADTAQATANALKAAIPTLILSSTPIAYVVERYNP